MDIYARDHVEQVWFVDPVDKLLEAHRLEADRWLRIGAWRGDVSARIEPFEAIGFSLKRFGKIERCNLNYAPRRSEYRVPLPEFVAG